MSCQDDKDFEIRTFIITYTMLNLMVVKEINLPAKGQKSLTDGFHGWNTERGDVCV